MTIKLGSLAADLKKEREGDWIEPKEWGGLNPEKPFEMTPLPGLALLVRSTNYPPYMTARQAALEKIKLDYPDGQVPPDAQARINGELAVQHLLLGWRGLDIEYSPDVVSNVLVAEEHRVLRDITYYCAGLVGKRKVEFVEAAAKN
ncbi:hypothetical protein [Mesorhizobium sp. B2-6-1]|uniref:hypothetical protein n=1 Tax=Mesorhizobium sp. B2-6-1 TaxID=2589916 RepID=UPI00112A1358|nr:hypothetical protein [Mesorhizobium sp. B2-6-1]TPJ60822.1 hypothetical protein FJ443_19980 [Mesorhizobium sp. B2-6-1]